MSLVLLCHSNLNTGETNALYTLRDYRHPHRSEKPWSSRCSSSIESSPCSIFANWFWVPLCPLYDEIQFRINPDYTIQRRFSQYLKSTVAVPRRMASQLLRTCTGKAARNRSWKSWPSSTKITRRMVKATTSRRGWSMLIMSWPGKVASWFKFRVLG